MGARGPRAAGVGPVLTVIETRRPAPPADLTEAEAEIWRDTVASSPADWFKKAFHPVLTAYCRHTARAAVVAQHVIAFKPEWLTEEGGLARYDKLLAIAERETRAVTACARALRLTPQSQIRATGAATAMRRGGEGAKPWE